jgi:hypothetical protein
MATYIPGVPSYLPEVKPFTPDYKFLSNVLDVKTAKYETNHKQLNDLYNKVVYGDLSRQDTKEMRDQYADNLAPKLQQISGMDLSMMQNVEAAKALFTPFFEEDIIVKDLVTTKQYKDQMQYADLLKNSSNDEQRRMYWQTGIMKMQYEMDDFVSASETDALKMGLPKYTPKSDLYNMAMKYLGESELGTDVITTISDDGEWLIHRKNGDLITNQALNMVQKALKNDPLVVDAYHADAFVKSRQYADKGIEDGRFSNIDQGQNAWAREKITEVEAEIEKRQRALEEKKGKSNSKNEAWNKQQAQEGIIKDSGEERLKNENVSELEVLRQKIKENKLLLENQPQSEKDFKTTGNYKSEDTKSLLYRAYSLMMNLGMESDLQAAAIDYSTKDMMSKLEPTPFQKHKFEMRKLETQHEYKKEEMRLGDEYKRGQIELEASLKGSSFLQDAFDFLKSSVSTAMKGAITGGQFDEDGVNIQDYIDEQEMVLVDKHLEVENQEVDLLLGAMHEQQVALNQGNGNITIDGIGTMTVQEMKKELLNPNGAVKKEYRDVFDNLYQELGNSLNNIDPETIANGQGAPILGGAGGIEGFIKTQKNYDVLKKQSQQLDNQKQALYKTAYDNLTKAVTLSFAETEEGTAYNELLKKATAAGMPLMFYKNEDGTYGRYTEAQYQQAYKDWFDTGESRRLGLSVEGVYVEGFDDRGFFKGDEHEQSWSDASNRMANLGEGATLSAQYKESGPWAGYGGDKPTSIVSEYNGPMLFSKERSDQQASSFYNMMNKLGDLAIRSKLESEHAKIYKKDAKDKDKYKYAEYAPMFNTYDVKQGLIGVDPANMTAGEILNNPVYTAQLDPRSPSKEGVEFLKYIDKHVNSDTTPPTLILNSVGFNEIQSGDDFFNNDPDEDILTASDDIDSEQLSLGESLYNQYVMDLTKRRSTDSKSLTDYPIASITYFPSWTSQSENLDSKYAGYTITLSDEYMSSLRKEGGILQGKGDYGNVLSVVIKKDVDVNPKKYGDFNFSYVASEIASNPKHSFSRAIPGGGSFAITQDLNGGYNVSYQVMQFNSENGNFDSAEFTEKMMNDRGESLTQSNRRQVDDYMEAYRAKLIDYSRLNIQARKAWMKANPDKVIKDLRNIDYRFSNKF